MKALTQRVQSVHQRPQWFQQRLVAMKIVDVLDEEWFEEAELQSGSGDSPAD